MNENHNNGRGIFYGVIGVATLVVAIIGATFAYFTATQSNNTSISGNAAAVSFGLKVERVENTKESQGLVPMSNSMVEQAVKGGSNGTKGFCVDDSDNLVCQIYKVTVTNTSTSSMFLDGYVTLTDKINQTSTDVASANTIMRWAQVFATTSGEEGSETTTYSTGGTTSLNADSEVTLTAIDAKTATDNTGKNLANIYVDGSASGTKTNVTGTAEFAGTANPIINANYIRISGHSSGDYNRTDDLTDALVFDQYLTGTGGDHHEAVLYFVVWMAENGTDQTLSGAAANNFFSGNVTFNSGAGGEVTATFTGYSKVQGTSSSGSSSQEPTQQP